MRGLDPDSLQANIVRARIVREKASLKKIYMEWYASMAAALPGRVSGPVLEIGSAGGFLNEFIPGLITSEIFRVPDVTMVADGQKLPVKDGALRAIVLLDVLHHLPAVSNFFSEAQRCVKPGGVIIMVEPWVTCWSKLIYRYLHQEPFDPYAGDWHFPVGGPMSQANSALPWIVFERDRHIFEDACRCLQVKDISLNGIFSYLLTGGVSYPQLVPDWIIMLFQSVERKLTPWMSSWAMFARIILRRTA